MKRVAQFILVWLLAMEVNAQSNTFDQFIYNRSSVNERGLIYWPHLREADVMYCWRVERMIDVREKMNILMKWPKNPLSHVLQNAMTEGYLTPYFSDSLDREMTIDDVVKFTSDEKVTFIPDETVFKNFKYHSEFLENQIWNYCFLNAGLKIVFNGKIFIVLIVN